MAPIGSRNQAHINVTSAGEDIATGANCSSLSLDQRKQGDCCLAVYAMWHICGYNAQRRVAIEALKLSKMQGYPTLIKDCQCRSVEDVQMI